MRPPTPGDGDETADSPFAETAPGRPASVASTLAAGSSEESLSVPAGELPVVERSNYELLGEHGRGGLGRILRARDRRTGRVVAIKEMLAGAGSAAERFRREAIVTSNLQHPAIVPVYEVGRWPDGTPFYAMKLVSGRSLAEAIRDAPSRQERLSLIPHVAAAADALAYAHDLGIIHRDLKPANVLVGRFGETVVIDWGLAKDVAGAEGSAEPVAGPSSAELTAAGSLMGTPAYMPPEQARGEPVDERADVYALGAMLYHVMGGAFPHADAAGGEALLERVRSSEPRPLGEADPDLPADLIAIASLAMARDPDGRYPSARELAEDLRRFAAGQLVRAHAYSARQLVARWARRHRAALAALAAAAVAIAGVGVYSFQRVRGERDTAERQRAVAERALGEAERADRASARSLARLHLDLGRQELDRGQPARALAHLAESGARAGRVEPDLALLAGAAAAAVDSRRWSASSSSRALASLVLSADRATGIVVGDDRVVERWDLVRGRRLDPIDVVSDVSAAALSPDGRWTAIAGNGLSLIDGATAQVKEVAPSAGNRILQVAISPDGQRVASGDRGGAIEIRRLEGAAVTARWRAHDGEVAALAWAGVALVSIGAGGDAAIWDPASGRPLHRLGAVFPAEAPEVDSTGRRVALLSPEADRARVFDVATGEEVAALAPGRVGGGLLMARLEPGGERAVTIDHDGRVVLWDVDGGRVIAELGRHAVGLVLAAHAPERGLLATLDQDGILRLWDAATGDLRRTLAHAPGRPAAITFLADGGLLAASQAGTLTSWRPLDAIDQARLAGHRDQTRRVAYLGDGARLASGSRDGDVRIWETATGRELRRIPAAHRGRVLWLAGSPDGSRLVSTGEDGLVKLWDPGSGALLHSLSGHVGPVVGAAWIGGDALASAGEDGTVRVWGADGGARCASSPFGLPLAGVAAAPGGLLLAWGAGPRSGLWRTDDCAAVRQLDTGHQSTIVGLISPDGASALLGGPPVLDQPPRGALLVDLAGGELTTLPVGDRMIVAAAFDRDGRHLATGGVDGRIDLWDRRGGSIGMIAGPPGGANAIELDSTGELLLAGGSDGVVRVWDRRSHELVAARGGGSPGLYQLRLRADGAQLAGAGLDPAPRLWRIPRWQGSASALVELARCGAAWRVQAGSMVPVDLGAEPGCVARVPVHAPATSQ